MITRYYQQNVYSFHGQIPAEASRLNGLDRLLALLNTVIGINFPSLDSYFCLGHTIASESQGAILLIS
jgi:hypothetical protein